MAARKRQERLIGRCAIGKVGFQQPLDIDRRFLRRDIVKNLLPDFGLGTEAPAGEDMKAIDGIVGIADRDARADHADVADVMLRAGMVATGEMDVDRGVDRDPRVAPVGDSGGVVLGVGKAELAAGAAGAGDQPGAEFRGFYRKADRLDGGRGQCHLVVGHARDQQILPDRQADFAIAQILRDFCQAAHLFAGHLAQRQCNADPVQSGLFLLVHADMRRAVEGGARRERFRRHAGEGGAKFFLDQHQELVHSHAVDDIFQPRLEAVGAVAQIDEHADNGVGHLGRIVRPDDDAGVLGKIPVPGNAANPQAKPDAGLDPKAVFHLDRRKSDVVGVFEHRDLAGAVEGDVELARQSRQRAVVENVKMPLPGIFAGVDQFLRIDPGGRRARDIADVVGAGTARAQAEVLDALDQRHRILGRNFTNLQIGAGGNMAEWPTQPLGEIGHSRQLPVLQDAVGNPQPAHVGILRRCDIKQSVIAPAKVIRRKSTSNFNIP